MSGKASKVEVVSNKYVDGRNGHIFQRASARERLSISIIITNLCLYQKPRLALSVPVSLHESPTLPPSLKHLEMLSHFESLILILEVSSYIAAVLMIALACLPFQPVASDTQPNCPNFKYHVKNREVKSCMALEAEPPKTPWWLNSAIFADRGRTCCLCN